jgi:hypothetical protein
MPPHPPFSRRSFLLNVLGFFGLINFTTKSLLFRFIQTDFFKDVLFFPSLATTLL